MVCLLLMSSRIRCGGSCWPELFTVMSYFSGLFADTSEYYR